MNTQDIFNVIYSNVSEELKNKVLDSVLYNMGTSEAFTVLTESYSSGLTKVYTDYVDILAHSSVSEASLDKSLDYLLNLLDTATINKVTESFMDREVRRALFEREETLNELFGFGKSEERRRTEDLLRAGKASLAKAQNNYKKAEASRRSLSSPIGLAGLRKISQADKTVERAKKAVDAETAGVKGNQEALKELKSRERKEAIDKLKGAAKQVWGKAVGAVKSGVETAKAKATEMKDKAVNTVKSKVASGARALASGATKVADKLEGAKAPKAEPNKPAEPEVKAEAPKAEPNKLEPNKPAESEVNGAPKAEGTKVSRKRTAKNKETVTDTAPVQTKLDLSSTPKSEESEKGKPAKSNGSTKTGATKSSRGRRKAVGTESTQIDAKGDSTTESPEPPKAKTVKGSKVSKPVKSTEPVETKVETNDELEDNNQPPESEADINRKADEASKLAERMKTARELESKLNAIINDPDSSVVQRNTARQKMKKVKAILGQTANEALATAIVTITKTNISEGAFMDVIENLKVTKEGVKRKADKFKAEINGGFDRVNAELGAKGKVSKGIVKTLNSTNKRYLEFLRRFGHMLSGQP